MTQPGGKPTRAGPGLGGRLLLAPGLGFLFVFFLVPIYYLGNTSLQKGDINVGYVFTWAWSNYSDALSTYQDQFIRSIWYGAVATVLCLGLGYPLAYFIAVRAGRYKNLLLMLVIAPFFVTYLIRTLAWQTILADEGVFMNILRAIGLMGDNDRILATSTAVIAGITYNFLPFMVLPLYASLEQVDLRLLDDFSLCCGKQRPEATHRLGRAESQIPGPRPILRPSVLHQRLWPERFKPQQ